MPIDNLGRMHFTLEQFQAAKEALLATEAAIQGLSIPLDADERKKYGKIAEQNKLVVEKVRDFQRSQPNLASPEVDWEEFERDYQDRYAAQSLLMLIRQLEAQLTDIKTLRDYDNYTDALRDYQYAKYKNRFAAGGYSTKIEEIKQFFPKTGKFKKQNPKND